MTYSEEYLADIASQLESYRHAKGKKVWRGPKGRKVAKFEALPVMALAREMRVQRKNLERFLNGEPMKYYDIPQYERFLAQLAIAGDPRQVKLPLVVYGTWKLHDEVRELSQQRI